LLLARRIRCRGRFGNLRILAAIGKNIFIKILDIILTKKLIARYAFRRTIHPINLGRFSRQTVKFQMSQGRLSFLKGEKHQFFNVRRAGISRRSNRLIFITICLFPPFLRSWF
jgi:hypothetical protein